MPSHYIVDTKLVHIVNILKVLAGHSEKAWLHLGYMPTYVYWLETFGEIVALVEALEIARHRQYPSQTSSLGICKSRSSILGRNGLLCAQWNKLPYLELDLLSLSHSTQHRLWRRHICVNIQARVGWSSKPWLCFSELMSRGKSEDQLRKLANDDNFQWCQYQPSLFQRYTKYLPVELPELFLLKKAWKLMVWGMQPDVLYCESLDRDWNCASFFKILDGSIWLRVAKLINQWIVNPLL